MMSKIKSKNWVLKACGVFLGATVVNAHAATASECQEILLNVKPGFFASTLAQTYQKQIFENSGVNWTIQHLSQEDFEKKIQSDDKHACQRVFIQPMASRMRFEKAMQGSRMVTVLGESSVALLASHQVRANGWEEWVQQAQTQPGHYRFSSGGVGHGMHVAMELLLAHQRLQLQHVVTKNSKEALQAMLDGRADITLTGFQEAQPVIEQGSAKALAVSGAVAAQKMPNLPLLEKTDAALNLTIPMALYAVDANEAQLQHLNAMFNQASGAEQVQQTLKQYAFAPLRLSTQAAVDYEQAYVKKYKPIYQKIGLIQ